ncbi:hypothetical protein BC939DRAFT_8476 [Gamsiella multidivaricata]|uniref:uncharacterized protein n=1 Tax=Gamsiella multidivaricata TaxID=101098 RepID=UPI00221FC080|nr:uncharacterized protein BC939DRAFT_8476 [Gamsiella multidivaricata]KAI7832853.1 hypothetical protein BC939DRAFT_8476 [Gamsiella multidivaricata]
MQRVARLFLSMGIVQLAQPRTLGSVTSSCSRNSDQLRMVSAERYIHGKCGHGASTLAHHILFLFFFLYYLTFAYILHDITHPFKMRTTRLLQGCLGSVDPRITTIHAFFRENDARHWGEVEIFFAYRHVTKTPHQHHEVFMENLKIIAHHKDISEPLQKRARFLCESVRYDKFMETFENLLLKTESTRAKVSVRGLYLHVARDAGDIPASSSSSAVPAHASSSSTHVLGPTTQTANPTTHIPNPAFSLPSHNLDEGTESSTRITDPASFLDSHVLGQDSAHSTCIPSAAGQKHPRDPWVELEEAPPKAPRNSSASPLTSTSSGSTAANSTTSTAGDSAVGMSAGRAGPSCASTELPPFPNASTAPPGMPPSFAASSSRLGTPPLYFGAAIDSTSSTTAATDLIASTTITGSAAGLNTSAAVPGLASESKISVRGLGRVTDSSSVPGSLSTTDGLPTTHSSQIMTGASDILPGSPGTVLAAPPSDDQSTIINADERAILLSQIEKITHTCAPQEGKACSTCLFKKYQRLSVDALVKSQLKIMEIADVVSLMGIFVPSRPTERMKSVFSDEILQAFIKSREITNAEWDSVEFNDSLAMKAVKVRSILFASRSFC